MKFIRYATALLPAAILIGTAMFISAHRYETDRARQVTDHARLAAASVDLRLRQLLELASFCATSPDLIDRVDIEAVRESCGRYALRIGAWVVVVETGDTHRQILNTRIDAPAVLPTYPREDEEAPLLALEERSRISGEPGIADVFTGIVLPEGIVSAGQYLRLADGRDAMVYVGVSARALSEQLAALAVPEGPIFGLIDPSRRVVARSVGIERAMFADAPAWIHADLEAGIAGASLEVPGPEVIGGTWDAGYEPLQMAPGWMAAAFQPTPVSAYVWTPLSLPSGVALAGLLLSGILLWGISDRDRAKREVETAQRAKAEAERQNRDKSRLLASFAHDIRSPLISLIGSLEMIQDGHDTGADQIPTARGAAEALLQLVDDILELSFLGSGQLTLHPSPVDLRQLATTLSGQMRGVAERKGLALRFELDADLPPIVEVDRLRLQQVLSNLLTNGMKYTDRGSVTLQIRSKGRGPGRVTIDLAVIDTGVGLAADDVPRIMREFGRLEREAERREPGTGLGLAIVQRILHGMGTTLQVESAPGEGSTFHFRLNLPIPIGQTTVDGARSLSGIVIVYAEDEPVIRQVTVRRLEQAGAQVVSAIDGEDALRHLAKITPDLLLIDLQMPVLDGVGLINRLKEVAPDRAYPVFVLTSHISGPQAAEARATGAAAVFTKPVQVAALASALQARRRGAGRSTPRLENATGGADGTLLDLETFQEATKTACLDDAFSLITEFEETLRSELAALQLAIDAGDMPLSGDVAHRALGLCLVMGTLKLAGQLRHIEEAAVAHAVVSVRAFASTMDPILNSTIDEMRSVLERSR